MASQLSAASVNISINNNNNNNNINNIIPKVRLDSIKNASFGYPSLSIGNNRLVLCRRLRACSSAADTNTNTNTNGGMSIKSVDMVLEEVRPYLIADGGNVDVVSVLDGVISLQLQGACGSCPSSTTTMKMGIERVLKEKFGDAVKEVRQVGDEPVNETTVEAVNRHLDILRPAIKNYGGEVDVIAIEGGDCTVKYSGPDTIGSGIKAAIKEKFPEIVNVIFTK